MVLLTNPQTADLQQRIQNSSFGSPDYLQGFTGTMPGYQQNLLANNFQPGLITRDFSGGATSMNPSGVANYLSYTPGVPPQAVNNSTFLPINTMVNAAVRQGGQGGGPMGDGNIGPGVSTEFVGDNAFRINEDGTVTQLNPESMDYKLANFMNTITGFSPMSMVKKGLGLDPNADYEATTALMNRVQNQYGLETAMAFRDAAFGTSTPTKTVTPGNYTGPTARETQADKLERQERERVAAAASAAESQSGGYSPNEGTTGTGGGMNPNQGPQSGGNNSGGNSQGSADGQGGVNSNQGPGSRAGGW